MNFTNKYYLHLKPDILISTNLTPIKTFNISKLSAKQIKNKYPNSVIQFIDENAISLFINRHKTTQTDKLLERNINIFYITEKAAKKNKIQNINYINPYILFKNKISTYELFTKNNINSGIPKIVTKYSKNDNIDYYICKPELGSMGNGISVTKNKNNCKTKFIGEYITPYLIQINDNVKEKYQTHLRIYVLSIYNNNILQIYRNKNMIIYSASKPYNINNFYNNKNQFLSNLHVCNKNKPICECAYKFDDLFHQYNITRYYFDLKIDSIISNSLVLLNKNNNPNKYHVLAFDFIISKDSELFLLEVNTKPGMISYYNLYDNVKLWNDTFSLTIDKLFNIKNKNTNQTSEISNNSYKNINDIRKWFENGKVKVKEKEENCWIKIY